MAEVDLFRAENLAFDTRLRRKAQAQVYGGI
jgi:hypothetical protein